MTNSIEFVTPVIKNGIELYVSADGSKSGMSQSGLALFCGVAERGIFGSGGIGEKLSQVDVRGWEAPTALKPFQGKVFHSEVSGSNGAKIITADCCAAFVEYYAFESRAANETAKFSYRKFASKGILQWIREETGRTTKADEQISTRDVMSMFSQLATKISSMEDQLTAINKTGDRFPVINVLNQQVNNNIVFLPAGFREPFSLREWVRVTKGVELSKGEMSSFGRYAHSSATTLKQRAQAKGFDGLSSYLSSDMPALEAAWIGWKAKKRLRGRH